MDKLYIAMGIGWFLGLILYQSIRFWMVGSTYPFASYGFVLMGCLMVGFGLLPTPPVSVEVVHE